MKARPRKPAPPAHDFSEHLDDGRVPEDRERRWSLAEAVRLANGGQTLGPIGDSVEVALLVDDGADFAVYLAEHAVWYHRP